MTKVYKYLQFLPKKKFWAKFDQKRAFHIWGPCDKCVPCILTGP